jgi:hypothetical protein
MRALHSGQKLLDNRLLATVYHLLASIPWLSVSHLSNLASFRAVIRCWIRRIPHKSVYCGKWKKMKGLTRPVDVVCLAEALDNLAGDWEL